MNNFKFGIDTEFFILKNTKGAHKVFPAWEFIKYSKEDPGVIKIGGRHFSYHWDNAALEVASPVYDPKHVSLTDALLEVKHVIDMLTPEGMTLSTSSYATLDSKQLMADEASVFGCNPDWDPYKKVVNTMPDDIAVSPTRYAGMHIHLSFDDPKEAGFDETNMEHYFALARACDLYGGYKAAMNSLLSQRRMKVYGRPGAFRPKMEYPGIEYRVLTPHTFLSIMGTDNPAALFDMHGVMNNWHRVLDPESEIFTDMVYKTMRQGREAVSASAHHCINEFMSMYDGPVQTQIETQEEAA